MKVLDLGCRTGSAIAAWQAAGDTVVGVDWENHGQQILGDFTSEETWEIIDEIVSPSYYDGQIPGPYDFIWFSPDCSIFSMANMRWEPNIDKDTFEPISERAIHEVEGIKLVLKKIRERKPRLGWIMENPRALMRKMDFTQDLHRATVTYCQYGFDRMKPTDLFGQIPESFIPKACTRGSSCHIPAPRGSMNSTQGMSKTEAGMIPFELSKAIRDAAIESNGVFFPTLELWTS